MWIVTVTDGSERSGCLVGFATQSSIDPLTFTVFISKKNHTFGVAERASHLAVHAVPKTRRDLAELFGSETGDDIDKFERCQWREGPNGLPIVEGCACWFTGAVLDRFDSGDHVAFLLRPQEGAAGDGAVLGFDDVRDLEPGHEP